MYEIGLEQNEMKMKQVEQLSSLAYGALAAQLLGPVTLSSKGVPGVRRQGRAGRWVKGKGYLRIYFQINNTNP